MNVDTRKRAPKSGVAANWKPWQTSPYLLVPMLVALIVIMAVLEHLTQLSQPALSKRSMRYIWFKWYSSWHGTDLKKIRASHPHFHNVGSCRKGIMNLRHNSDGQYFAFVYLPSALAIVAAILWGIIDDEVKRIEPYHQASWPGSANVGSTMFADYISAPSLLSPFQALYRKQWTVLLSAICYVIIGTVTPILQSQLFRVQVQVIQVGYNLMGDPDHFTPFRIREYDFGLDLYDKEYDGPIYGRCVVAGEGDYQNASISIGDMLGIDESQSTSDEGAIRPVLYLAPSWSRAQETLLLLIVVLGALLTYRLFTRRSGMTASYGSLASLSAIATVDSGFLKFLSNTMDLNDRRACVWRTRLERTTVHLGNVPSKLSHTHGSSSSTDDYREAPYGLYFGSFPIPDSPLSTRDRTPSYRRVLKWIPRLCIIFAICTILSVVGGTLDAQSSANRHITEAQNSIIPTIVLIISAITKTLWKSMEQRVVAMTPFYHRFSTSLKSELSAYPTLGRDYSRMPLGSLTIHALRDKQYTPAFVSFMSMILEIANFLLAFAASMSQGSGWNAHAYFRVSVTATVLYTLLLLFCWFGSTRLVSKYTPLLNTPSSIATRLAYVSRSDSLLNDMLPLNVITDTKDRMAYLKSLPGSYCFGQVKAPELTGGFIYGIEKSDAVLPFHRDGSFEPEFREIDSNRRMRKRYSERRRQESSSVGQQTTELC